MAVAVVAGLASTAGAYGTAVALSATFSLAWAGTAFAIGAGLSMISQALQPSLRVGQDTGLSTSVANPIAERPIIYGRTRTGGTIVYFTTSGADNKYLHLVIAVAGHAIDGYEKVYFDDEVIWEDGSYVDDWVQNAQINFYDGTQTTADQDLINASNEWNSNCILNDTAYIHVRLEYDPEVYTNGIPSITTTIRGKKVLDPRTDVTAWSENPALCIYDYLKDPKYGLNDNTVNEAQVIASANVCDQLVTIDTGVDQTRYALSGFISTGDTIKANLEKMLSSMFGKLVCSGGELFVNAGYYTSPVLDINESLLVGAVSLQTKTSRRNVYNAVKGTFLSEEENYIFADYPSIKSDTYSTEDGEPLYLDLPLPCTTNNVRAQRLAKLSLNKSRQQRSLSIPVNLAGLKVRAGDVIRFTSERLGISNAEYEVIDFEFEYSDQLIVNLVCVETGSSLYDWTVTDKLDFSVGSDITLYDGTAIAPTGLTATAVSNILSDGTDSTYIDVTWTNPSDIYFDYVVLKYGDQSIVTKDQSYRINNVDENTQYTITISAYNTFGRQSTGLSTNVTTVRDTTAPANITSITATGGLQSIDLSWTNPSDDDFDLVRIKVASTNVEPASHSYEVRADNFIDDVGAYSATRYYWLAPVDRTGNVGNYVSGGSATTGSIDYGDINNPPTIPVVAEVATTVYLTLGDNNAPTDTEFNTAVGRDPIENDLAIINKEFAFSYNGTAWTAVTEFIDGSLLVSESITTLGDVTAGTFSLGSGAFEVNASGELSATGASISGEGVFNSGLTALYNGAYIDVGRNNAGDVAFIGTRIGLENTGELSLDQNGLNYTGDGLVFSNTDTVSNTLINSVTTLDINSQDEVNIYGANGVTITNADFVGRPTWAGLNLALVSEITTPDLSGYGALAQDETVTGDWTFSGSVSGIDYGDLDNTPTLITQSDIDTAITNLVDSSPDTLNTLNELANALGDDPNFATTVSTSIGTKANKAGDTFTGAVTIQQNGNALVLKSTTSATSTGILFDSDLGGSQAGHIKYTHSNSASYGGTESFTIGGTEESTVILADGQFYYKDGIYKKPASGTGAGTRKDTNWDTAYGWGDHSTQGYLTSYSETDTLADVTGRGATTNSSLTLNGKVSFGSNGTYHYSPSGARVNNDARDSGDGARLHRWNRNHQDSAYLPYYEHWYDGNSYHSIGIDSNRWKLSDGLDVSGTVTATGGNSTNWNTAYTYSQVGHLPLTGGTLTGNLTLNSATPEILFNGTSDAGVDMAIKATPEGLDFYEPEQNNKIHFQILDDTGVNSPYGYKVGGVRKDLNWDTAYTYSQVGHLPASHDMTLTLSGDATGSATFTNMGNATLNVTVADNSHNHSSSSGDFSVGSNITANRYFQRASGIPTNNLGSPTVTEMALFDSQFNNKTEFFPPSALRFYQTTDGTNWTEITTYSDDQKKRFLHGDANSSVVIPNQVQGFRVEVDAQGYVFLNALYMYWSSQSHNTTVHVYRQRNSDSAWLTTASSSTTVSSWPGHLYLPFNTITFNPTNSSQHGKVRIEFTPNWSTGSYADRNINLYSMQLWGGYPAGKRNVYYTDQDHNVDFPSEVKGTSFNADSLFKVNGTTVIDSSRNLTSIGNIGASGAVTANGFNVSTLGGVTQAQGEFGIGSGNVGIHFNNSGDNLLPFNHGTLAFSNGVIDFGHESYRYKDGFFSGKISVSALEVYGNSIKFANLNDSITFEDTGNVYSFNTDAGTGNAPVRAGSYQVGTTTVIDSSRNLTNVGTISASGKISTTSTTVLSMYGAGSGTYTQGMLYCGSGLLSIEAPLTSDSSAGGHTPIRLTWRGGYVSQGGVEIGDGYTQVDTLRIGGTTAIDSSRNLTNIGKVNAGAITNDNTGAVRILHPDGASYTSNSATGAIKITLPVAWTNTMMRMTVKVYEYSTGESFEVAVGGYNHTGSNGLWYNTFAHIISDPDTNRNFTVRFGHDGTKACIWIGETNSSWSYPKVSVVDFQAGHSSANESTWATGWAISFVTTLGTIQRTHTNNEVGIDGYEKRIGGTTVIDSSRNIINSGSITTLASPTSDMFWLERNDTSGITSTIRNNTGGNTLRLYGDYANNGALCELQIQAGQNGDYAQIGTWTNQPLYLKTNNSNKVAIETNGDLRVMSGSLKIGSTTVINSSRTHFAGVKGYNTTATGTTSITASTGIKQTYAEGWTAVFADYEPYHEWGLYHDNPQNRFIVTGGNSTNNIGSFSVTNHSGNTRTAYEKIVFNQSDATVSSGGGYKVGTTTVIDSSRNLTNIASITTSRVNLSAGQFIKLSGATDSTHHIFHNASTDYDEINVSTGFKVSHYANGDRLTLVGSTGDLTVSGNVTAYSDVTLKDNITNIDNALDKVNSIRGVTYDRIDQDNARHAGVIAQEVEAVLPEVVHTDDNGIKSVAYGNMVGLLIEAIKELKSEIEVLKNGTNSN